MRCYKMSAMDGLRYVCKLRTHQVIKRSAAYTGGKRNGNA